MRAEISQQVDDKRAIGLRIWVLILVLGAVVPLLLFAGAALFQISRDAHVARDQGLTNTARALALAVEGEVRSWKAALAAMSESRSLRPDRLAEFYDEARQFTDHERDRGDAEDPRGAPAPKALASSTAESM